MIILIWISFPPYFCFRTIRVHCILRRWSIFVHISMCFSLNLRRIIRSIWWWWWLWYCVDAAKAKVDDDDDNAEISCLTRWWLSWLPYKLVLDDPLSREESDASLNYLQYFRILISLSCPCSISFFLYIFLWFMAFILELWYL